MAELNYAKKRLAPMIEKYNIDVEKDKVFQSIITLFNGQTDYQMWGIKVVYSRATTLEDLVSLKEWADANPTEISHLTKHNLVSYKTVADIATLHSEMESLDAIRLVKGTINRFNTAQRHILTETILERITEPTSALNNSTFRKFFNLAKAFEVLPAHRQQKFLSLMSAVTSVSAIMSHLDNAIQETYDWNREDMLSYAQRCCPDTEVVYDENNVVIIRVPSFESSQKLCGNGRTAWCLTRDSGYFKRYTKDNQNAQQFFLFDFNRKENHDLAHVGFSVNPSRGINYAHSTRNNNLMDSVTVDGQSWNINKVLAFHNIGKNVYIRLKQLKSYKWDKVSFTNLLTRHHIPLTELEDGRLIVEITDERIFDAVMGHTLCACPSLREHKAFALLDFSKDVNNEKSILLFIFGKDKYETLSFKQMYDTYNSCNVDAKVLAKNNLTSDMFVKQADINPNILLHKYIDEANINAAIKLLEENKDIDPNTVFYSSIPVIKAIFTENTNLFDALLNHPHFNINLTERFGYPYAQFLMIYIETKLDDKSVDKNALIHMLMSVLTKDGYQINKTDLTGDTVLHHACETIEFLPVVEYLVSRKDVDINMENSWGFRAIDVAIDNDRPLMEMIELLLKRDDLVLSEDTLKFASSKGLDLLKLRTDLKKTEEQKRQETESERSKYENIFAKAFAK